MQLLFFQNTYVNLGVNGWSGRGVRCDGLDGYCDGRGSDCSGDKNKQQNFFWFFYFGNNFASFLISL